MAAIISAELEEMGARGGDASCVVASSRIGTAQWLCMFLFCCRKCGDGK